MNKYSKPIMESSNNLIEQNVVFAESGCDSCCPYNRSTYDPGFCPYADPCPQDHFFDENKNLIGSTCPLYKKL